MPKNVFLTQTLQFISLYLFLKITGTSTWHENKLKEISFVLITYCVYIVLSRFVYLLKPISIEISQTNNLGSNIQQTLIVKKDNEFKQSQSLRTVKLNMKVTRKNSVWWKILLSYIKNKNLIVSIEAVPRSFLLQAEDGGMTPELITSETGFHIHINELLEDMCYQNNEVTIDKTYTYFVVDHPDYYIPQSVSSIVQPRIIAGSKPLFLLSFFINFKSELHNIRYFNK
ncbi:hypothetical protein COM08_15455 [Bacillus wiedmannii]|uniref:hypothetical protein n=1 Tax=Bacillus TaxID=1386 RepID=UPI000BF8721F|nr:hypothetical protein [Bacillus wiedmannii]PGC17897.1 hypothetical protein COM08_15455 [Bacillus wiedmannii]